MSNIAKMLEVFNKNPYLNIIFLVLAFISIIVSIIFFLASRKAKKPSFYLRTFKLIQDRINKIGDVEILYKGQRVDNISLTRVALWNRGRDTIDSSHVAKIDPIRIIVKHDCKLLSAEIIYSPVQANNFRIRTDINKGEISIDFDYFHKEEGVIIQIYHTGKSNDDVELIGTIKGVRKLSEIIPGEDYYFDRLIRQLEKIINSKTIPSPYLRIPVMILTGIVIAPTGVLLQFADAIRKLLLRVPQEFIKVIST